MNVFLRNFLFGLMGVTLFVALILFSQLVETNHAGFYQVKQAALTGTMSIRSEPGTYYQGGAKITTYPMADDIALDGVDVRFRDGSTAKVYGTVKYRLPVGEAARLKLHQELQAYENVKENTVRTAVEGAIKQDANLFGAEEVYSTRRSEFVQYFQEQLVNGIYDTDHSAAGNTVTRNAEGKAIVIKPSVLTAYGFEIVNVEITDIDFDDKTDALIKARKEAEQNVTVARAQAEQAKQDTITTEEKGKADVATARYAALVEKEKAVVEAEKTTAVQQQVTLQAAEKAKQTEAQGRADALAAQLKVAAGLTPLDKANIEKDTAIGVAKELSKITMPTTMVIGGSKDGGGALDPFTAIGLNQMLDMSQKFAKTAK